jgi:hypothetical protein
MNMKSLIFDAGPVISLTTNNLLWLLEPLKGIFKGEFQIPPAVKVELVDRPLQSHRFKFEALQVMNIIRSGVFSVVENPNIKLLAEELLDLANHTFKTRGNWLTIFHYAEMEVLASAIVLNASAVVIDERTTKQLVESPNALQKTLEENMRSKVFVNQQNLDKIRNWVKSVRVIRSVELAVIAYEKGLLNNYIPDEKDAKKTLVESLLWGVKLRGCAVSRPEIDEIVRLETAQKS